ncbi:MAG: Gfo/Idh/MocA family oxidoreductase [Pricia sp.]|nr:Gfo/Idh/MocA family oxidoreductase [Pricia sp.]
MAKIKWGILGTATIAVEAVIPAMLQSIYSEVAAVASRDIKKAKDVAGKFAIRKWYGNYDELLDDPQIQAVYVPLPNHLHVAWAIKALRSGKHVLVEKPIALNAKEAEKLLEETQKHPDLHVMEAFMYKFHPQWIRAREMVQEGAIGSLKIIQASFSFFETDPKSIVNRKDFGGGSLMDVGCYPVSISRLLFESEPKSVLSHIEYDPKSGIDSSASGILEFEDGSASFFCATQLVENQQVQIFGTEGSIKFELPFNPPNDRPSKIWLTRQEVTTEIKFEICDQYMLQADAFSLAILEGKKVPGNLNDAMNNMVAIEKIRESHESGRRVYF